MLKKYVQPTSILGILRLAKQLKKELGVSLSQAQDEAAKRAGFHNLTHAQRMIGQRPPLTEKVSRRHRVFISAHWVDRDTSQSGREVWWVDLSKPYADLVTRMQMREQSAMARLEPRAQDHLFFDYRCESSERARHYICRALRAFQFVDATKLRPSKAHSRVYPGGSSNNAIPGRDHYTAWYEPVSKGYVFVDEPYEPSALRNADARAAWAAEHGYDVVKPNWPGMYSPGEPSGSRLYLVASLKDGPPLAALAQALNKLPSPLTQEEWKGESMRGLNPFVSPATLQSPEPKVTPARKVAVRVPQQPRPNRMPIITHEEIGRQLKAIHAETFHREGVRNRLDEVRNTLDDWIQREYTPLQLPMEQFSEVYYGSAPKTTFEKSLSPERREQHIAELGEVKSILEQHYSDALLRQVASRINRAVKSLETWR